MDLTFTRRNQRYDVNAQPGVEDSFENFHVQPELMEPAIYLDPHIAGQIICSSVEIFLDNVQVEGGSLQTKNNGQLFQRSHRIGATDQLREEKYSMVKGGVWVSNSAQMGFTMPEAATQPTYVPAVAQNLNVNPVVQGSPIRITPYTPGKPLIRHPNLIACQEPLRPDTKTVSNPVTLRMGFDLNFPISVEANGLALSTGQRRANPALPPGCKIDFKLHHRSPRNSTIERADVSHAQYFQAGHDPLPVEEAYNITMTDISLVYESALLTEDELKKIQNDTFTYPVDSVVMRQHQMLAAVFHETVRIPLAAGSRFLYIMFVHESQLAPGVRPRGYQSSRTMFPPGLENLQLGLLGKDGLLYQKGLYGLGIEAGRKSHSLRAYHAEMVQKGLISRDWDTWFPRWADGRGHDQYICMNLLGDHKNFVTQGDLELILSWKEISRFRWNILVFAITEEIHQWTRQNGWSLKKVVN